MKKTKILFFHFDLGNGGAEKVLVNLANGLDKQKYNVEIRTIFNYGPNRYRLAQNVKYTSVFNRKAFRGISVLLKIFSPKILHKLFIKDRYDIEIAFREGGPGRVISGCQDAQTKKYAWIHTTLRNRKIASRGYRNLHEFVKCCMKFDGIAAVSNVVKQSVEQWLPESMNVTTIYNVVEPHLIRRQAAEPIDIQLNKDGCLNITSVGRLTPVKSFDRMLSALSKARRNGYENWHLYIIGVGELQNELLTFVANNNIKDKVTFLGYQSNPHKYVSKMDLFVCSSLIEGYSTAVTEAIINGVPVLTTDCAGMYEIFGDTEAGIIVENTESALYDGIVALMEHPGKLHEMRTAARTRSTFFSKENTVQKFEEFVLG